MHKEFTITHRSDHVIESEIKEHFASEQFELNHTAAVDFLVDQLEKIKGDTVKLVSFVGGAGAGKTTFVRDLVAELRNRGFTADALSTDGFVVGDREHRRTHLEGKDPLKKYDFEYLHTLVDRIRDIKDDATTIGVPTYDDKTGVAIAAGEANYTHRIGKVDFLIVEGDFDPLQNPDMHVYMHVPDEARLQNRLGRDEVMRSETDKKRIVDNFNLRQELQHIPHTTPAIKRANLVLDIQSKDGEYTYTIRLK